MNGPAGALRQFAATLRDGERHAAVAGSAAGSSSGDAPADASRRITTRRTASAARFTGLLPFRLDVYLRLEPVGL